MAAKLIAKSTIVINAPVNLVWKTIVDESSIPQFMMGMRAESEWKTGSEIRWIGRHEEKPDDNARGTILDLVPDSRLTYTFYYPGYGYPDESKYYNTIQYDLQQANNHTELSVQQGDFNAFGDNGETFMQHSQTFWEQVLKNIKEIMEQ